MLEGCDSKRVVANKVNGNEALPTLMCFVAADNHKGVTVDKLWWRATTKFQWKTVKKNRGGKLKTDLCFGKLMFWAMNANMEIGWEQFGHKKRSQHKVHKNQIIFHINGCISDFQFLSLKTKLFPNGRPKTQVSLL